jgi:hypothetical protein
MPGVAGSPAGFRFHGREIAVKLKYVHSKEAVMPAMELTEVVAWALIVGGVAFAALERRGGLPAAAVTATLAALATKTVLLG